MSEKKLIINISFTKQEADLLKILDELVKYDLASNRSAWFKDQIRNRYHEMISSGVIEMKPDEE